MKNIIEEVSGLIWSNCENRPTRRETKPFDEQISKVNIKDLIVYNFLNYPSTALSEFLLATFQFWNHLSLNEWSEIFERIRNNSLAEYYMTVSQVNTLESIRNFLQQKMWKLCISQQPIRSINQADRHYL